LPEFDDGIITDAYGPRESVEEWHNAIGKPPMTD